MDTVSDSICTFTRGEERGVELLKQLVALAPDGETRDALHKQISDERRHAHLFGTALKDLGIDCEGMRKNLRALYDHAQQYLDEKDWAKCIAIQAVIEELAMASFAHYYPRFSAEIQQMLKEIISDEQRHLAFCIHQLRVFNPEARARMSEVHHTVISIMRDAANYAEYTDNEKQEARTIMKKAYALHKGRLREIGLRLPSFSSS